MNKDYYKILEVSYTANEWEIKKSYRQLAMKFHPDKNEGNALAETRFREVQEAYEILSHPAKRSAYNQQRWYRYNDGKTHNNASSTPYNILHKCKALSRYISTLDNSDINIPALNNYILNILSKSNLDLLIKDDDKLSNEFIIDELLKSAYPLPFKFFQRITRLLMDLAANDNKVTERINIYLRSKKMSHYWAFFLPLTVLIISVLLCLLIYFVSNIHQ